MPLELTQDAQYAIIGPVADTAERILYYFKSTDCDVTRVCGEWKLAAFDLKTATETIVCRAGLSYRNSFYLQ